MTSRHIGGGHKQKYRIIDFKRKKRGVVAEVIAIEYDPNRTCAHRADPVHGRREEPTFSRRPVFRSATKFAPARTSRRSRQRASAQGHSARHQHSQHRADSRPRRPDRAQRRAAGHFEQPRSRLRAGQNALGRNPQDSRNLLRDDRPGRQRRAHERLQRQGRAQHAGSGADRPSAAW